MTTTRPEPMPTHIRQNCKLGRPGFVLSIPIDDPTDIYTDTDRLERVAREYVATITNDPDEYDTVTVTTTTYQPGTVAVVVSRNPDEFDDPEFSYLWKD